MNAVKTCVGLLLLQSVLGGELLHAATYQATVLSDNPYGYWRLNETIGTTALNLGWGGALLNGNYAQFSPPDGVPALGSMSGIPGGGAGNTAAYFTPNSQVYIPDPVHPTAYTIEAWVRPDAGFNTTRNVLVRTAGNPTTTNSHQIRLDSAGRPMHYSYSSTGAKALTGSTVAAGGEWTHIVGVAENGNPAGFKVYVNGVQEATWTGNIGTLWNGGNQWRIGSIAAGGGWFQGAIAEVAVYHSMLSSARVMDHYAVGTTAMAVAPVGMPAPTSWLAADAILGHSDGAAVSVWGDASGNGNHAAQSDPARQPTYVVNGINSLPSVRFDGNDILTSVASFGNPYSIFSVTQMEGTQNFRLVTSQDVNWLMGNWGGQQNVMHAGGWVESVAGVPADTLPHLYAAMGDGVRTTFVHNGQVLAWNGTGTAHIGRLKLGGYGTGFSEASKADVAEVIVYDRVLTPAEQASVQGYLAGKYGLTLYGPVFGEARGFGGPADLDLDGPMVYAIDVSPSAPAARPVGGAVFTRDNATPGVSVAAQHSIDNWGTKPEYGSSTDDDNLEEIMHDIRWSANSPVTANMDVVRGNTYKLQLLFSENAHLEPGRRPFDIYIDGVLAHDEFDPVYYRGTWDSVNRGAVYTATFTAGDSQLNVALTPGSTGDDRNPILNAFTLEQVAAKPIRPPITTERIRLHLGEEAGAMRAVDAAFADGVQSGNWTTGTPQYDVPGIPANAAVDTAVRLNGSQQLTVMDAVDPTAYTLEAWVNPAALANMNILDRTSSNVGHISHQLRLRADGRFEHYTYDGAGRTIAGTTAAAADEWYHVVATATNGGRMQLFVNGQLENEWGNLGTLWAGGDRWRIAGPAGSFGGFNGTMDEISIHPVVMPGDEVFVRYRQTAMPTVPQAVYPKVLGTVYSLDLADVVGHGDGLGSGSLTAGINPGTGELVAAGTPNPGEITGPGFHPVSLPFVDGVFIPGAAGFMQIASTGLTMQHNYPARDGRSWDHFRNGPTDGASRVLSGVDYTSDGHSLIDMHANKGITFDLDAIRAAHGGTDVNQFTTTFGDVAGGNGNTDFNVYLDGRLVYGIGGDLAAGRPLQIAIGRERFLTIVASDGGDAYSYDQIILGDPTLELGRNIAYGKPVGATAMYSSQYAPTAIVDGRVNEEWTAPAMAAYWLLPNATLGAAVIDLEGEFLIDRIDLQNTHNGGSKDRGTRDFTLLVSLDGDDWTEVVSDTLSFYNDASTAWLNTPLESFEFDEIWARFVKFQVDSYYGVGGGLAELRVFETVPEPGSLMLLFVGALAALLRRRRG